MVWHIKVDIMSQAQIVSKKICITEVLLHKIKSTLHLMPKKEKSYYATAAVVRKQQL